MSVNRFSLCFDCPVHGIRRLYQVALWLRQRLQRHLAGAVGACRSVIGFWAAQWLVVRGRERARKGVLSPSVCASLAS